MSVAEQIFWKMCRGKKLGFEFRRQHPVGPYVLDFYCPEARLAVELDGEQHDPEADARRDAYVLKLGIATHRIPNPDFLMLEPSDAPRVDVIRDLVLRLERITGRSSGL